MISNNPKSDKQISKQNFNLLILGGGKRVGLVKAFKTAADDCGLDISCHAYEYTEKVPVSLEAEIIKGLSWDDPRVLSDIKSIIREKEINWVCACVDQATLFLEEIKNEVLPELQTTSKKACQNLLDKKLANEIASAAGLSVIPESHEAPLFVKPRIGSASKGAGTLDSKMELEEFKDTHNESEYLFQKICAGKEFTVDCFTADNEIFVSPRVRVETIGGEVLITETVDREDIVQQSIAFIKAAKIYGPSTIQFIEHNDELFFMECNPRFGGGVLCSIQRGFDYPKICIAMSHKTKMPSIEVKSNVVMYRYLAEAFFETNN